MQKYSGNTYPLSGGKSVCTIEDGDMSNGVSNMIHRAYRYGGDYEGLKGKDLSKKIPLAPEGCPQFYKAYGVK